MIIDLRIRAHHSWKTFQLRLCWHELTFDGSLSLPFLRLVLRVHSDDPATTGSAR